jgi:hypothetical protein
MGPGQGLVGEANDEAKSIELKVVLPVPRLCCGQFWQDKYETDLRGHSRRC